MSYARTDDGFYAKPAVLETDLAALGLCYLARVYCADHQTDGKITAAAVVMLARSSEQADILSEHLCATGLWVRDAENFRDASFLTDNPSAREVEKAKKAAKLRMRTFRVRSSERNAPVTRNKRRTNAFVPERSGEERGASASSGVSGESEGRGGSPPRSKADLTDAFETRFWPAYPPRNGRRDGKPEALAEWLKLRPDRELEAVILAALPAYARSTDLPKDACRWLKGKRWTDETTARLPGRSKVSELAAQFRAEVAARAAGGVP